MIEILRGNVVEQESHPVHDDEIEGLVRAWLSADEAEIRATVQDRAGDIVSRAIARGEVPPNTNPGAVIETLIAPIHFRLLVTREDLDAEFVQTVAEQVVAGVSAEPDVAATASRPKHGAAR